MMIPLRKFVRGWLLGRLDNITPEKLQQMSEARLLKTFRRAASQVPAYRELLAEHGVKASDIRTVSDYQGSCPLLDKQNTFGRFPLQRLLQGCQLTELASVLTSSGFGARFAYGMSTRREYENSYFDIDLGLQQTFDVDNRRTLVINTLPMGVRFNSRAVCLAETSVREDMACAIARDIGADFDQIILFADPLFLKCLVDYAADQGISWPKNKLHCVIGEETFHEHFRSYLAKALNIDIDAPDGSMILSSMGVGELGLNLMFESRETVTLKRHLHRNTALFEQVFGFDPNHFGMPMLFLYNPLRCFVEVLNQDEQGFGDLVVSMLGEHQTLPLLRYQTGDRARLLDWSRVNQHLTDAGLPEIAHPPLPLVALAGRSKDMLPGGLNLAQFKDVLYQDELVAAHLTGAWRLETEPQAWRLHIQLRTQDELSSELQQRFRALLPQTPVPCQLSFWKYSEFPFGMRLDYERKFTYWLP